METIISSNSSSVQQQRTPPPKRSKANKKKPIKVVYISNPMKVNTTASAFRALVQELTGQYAQSPPDPSRLRDVAGGVEGGDGDSSQGFSTDHHHHHHHALVVPPPPVLLEEVDGGGFSSFENFEPFDDDIFSTPQSHHQMVENDSSSTVFYESPLFGHHW